MTSRTKVLVFATDPSVTALAELELRQILGESTYCIVGTLAEYLTALFTLHPHLVITELDRDPNVFREVISETKQRAPEVPLIVLTSMECESVALDATELGIWDSVCTGQIRRLGATAQRALSVHQVRSEHRALHDSLKQSEQRLLVAQRLGQIGHWEFDPETNRLHWSDAVYAMYGRDPSLGPPSETEEAQYYSVDTLQELRQLASRAIATGEPYELSSAIRRSDGSTRHITIIGSTMADLQGRVVRLLGTVQDVTERKRADTKIRELNSVLEALRSIHQLIIRERDPARLIAGACSLLVRCRGYGGAWVVLFEPSGSRAQCAHAGFDSPSTDLETLWAYAAEQQAALSAVRSQTPSPFGAPPDPEIAPPQFAAPNLARTVVARVTADNSQIGVLGVSFPEDFGVGDEETVLLRELAEDLAHALSTIELEAQRNRFAQIVQSSHEAMALVSLQFTYLEVNSAYSQLLGKTCADLIGRKVSEFVPEALFEQSIRPNLETCFSGRSVEFETELQLPGGSTRRLAAAYSPCFLGSETDPERGLERVSAAAVCIRDITVQSVAIAALQAGERRYRLLAEGAGVGIAYYGLDGTLLYYNTRAAQVMGGTPSDFVGKSLCDLYGSELADIVLSRIECVASSLAPRTFKDLVRLGPESSWYISTFSAIADELGKVTGVQIISHDITDLKRVELALQMERDNFSAFLAATPAAILVLNHARELVHCNSAATRLLGHPQTASAVEHWTALLHCARRESNGQACASDMECEPCSLLAMVQDTIEKRANATGRHIAINIPVDQTTERRWFIASTEPLSLGDGPGAVLALQDVTDRKVASELLEYQALLLKSQNEASIDGILIEDPLGRLLWHNRRLAEIFALAADGGLQGRSGVSMVPIIEQLEDAAGFERGLADLATDRNARSRAELRLKDGRVLDYFGAPLLGNSGEYLGRVWRFRDITDEQALRAAVAQSDRLASMGMLAAGVAHEINNPLSYVIYNLESLVDDLDLQRAEASELHRVLSSSPSALRYERLGEIAPSLLSSEALADMNSRFRSALDGARRIKAIARGLGTFSRVEKGRLSPICISDPIESAFAIAFNEIKCRARIEKQLLSKSLILASDGQLSQVFLNLLINAAHSIADGNADTNLISVRTWEQGNQVFATVEDSGCGIPEENLERVFDAFYTTKPVGVGSGLGLNIVRSIVTSFGGKIHVSSRVGMGTRFVIRLPIATSMATASEIPSRSSADLAKLGGRILLVDDEPQVRSAVTRILSGYSVVQCKSGEEARQLLSQDRDFDLILSDVMMPQMSGIDLHRWLLAYAPSLARHMVFVTGGAFTPGANAYLESVGNPRIAKPFDQFNFRQQVAGWVLSAQAENADCEVAPTASANEEIR